MRQLFLFFVVGVIFVACNDNKPEKDLSITPLKSVTNDSTNNGSLTGNQNLPQQLPATPVTGMPPQTQSSMPQSAIPQTVSAGTTAAGMNPAHGKPGHKCEIPVGAPLNSAPTRTATTATTVSQPTMISQPTTISKQTNTQPPIAAAKTITAKGMNPPHGEPGHRCDISVGAPLNSAPTAAAKPPATNGTANITPMEAPIQNTSLVPALQNTPTNISTKTSTAFSGKINPAHGQPGHDCKVAVGQPLP